VLEKENILPTGTQSTAIAIFNTETEARAAVDDLRANGFQSNEIFVSSDASAQRQKGEIKKWFDSIFGQEDENERPYYEGAVRHDKTLVGLNVTPEKVNAAVDLLNHHSPVDVQQDVGETQAARAAVGRGTATLDTEEARSIPIVEEQLRIGKRSILRGGVRVHSRVVEKPFEEDVALREEHVRVERVPVDRAGTEADLRSSQDQVVEVKEYAEELVVSKQPRVVEEVRVGKEATERTETVRDRVRHTEVEIENLSRSATQGGAKADTPELNDFRRHFRETHGSSGETYETYGPAYEYGYTVAGDPRYRSRNFDEVESDLREDYTRRYRNSTWEKVKGSVRYGWEKLRRRG
jgi:stress response protein YsnF